MSEGRKCQVVLLDERRLDILVQPRLYAGELLDMVSSHFNLKEKEYFGLSFIDDTGHHHWLQLDRKVLEHEFPKKVGATLVLYFAVRFFIESIAYLRDNTTIELFYLQAKQSVFQGDVESDSETAFELAAHVLQATHGDYVDDQTTRGQLKKLPVLPTSALKDHPSLSYCEEQVISHYKKLSGQSRGSAIVNYMTIAESLPTYGIHYYEVKDKNSLPWWLGISYKGIAQYDYADKKTPRKVFSWKHLENLYFRERKFSIEVHDPKRIVHTLSSFNLYEDAIQEPLEEFDELSDAISDPTTQVSVSRRTFGPGNVNVFAWFAATPSLTKCIWSMAVNQHQFYLDRKQSKSQLPTVRSMSEIAADLCQSTSSLQSSTASDNISRTNSAASLSLSTSASRLDLTEEQLEANRAAQRDMFLALKARKDALEEALRRKTEELKALCIKEGELTGELPHETPLLPGDPVPQIRRRVGTAFSISPKIINRDQTNEHEEMLANLELEYDLQGKITSAAQKLAHDSNMGKAVRKQRKQSYHKAYTKLKSIEKKLNDARRYSGKALIKALPSVEDLSEDSVGTVDSDSEYISPMPSPAIHRSAPPRDQIQVKVTRYPKQVAADVDVEEPILPETRRPPTPSSQTSLPSSGSSSSPARQPNLSRDSTPSPVPNRQYPLGYTPSSVYTTRTQYRNQMYPTFSTRSQSSASSQSEYDNVKPAVNDLYVHNLYNVGTTKTSLYNSTDELETPTNTDSFEAFQDNESQNYPSKTNSLDAAYRRGKHNFEEYNQYCSLDRNFHSADYLDDLTPSRFGCKVESVTDYRDPGVDKGEHVYYPNRQYNIVEKPRSGNYTASDIASDYVAQRYGNEPYTYDPHATNPYMNIASGDPRQHWHSRDVPTNFEQQPHYEGSESQYYPQEQSGYNQQVAALHGGDQQPMTVTKYHQSYVEVSKPFEMSDFYKYSERLRRQRSSDSQSVSSQGSNSQTPYKAPPSPYMTPRSVHPSMHSPHDISHSTPYMTNIQTQSKSRPSSPYSSSTEGSSQYPAYLPAPSPAMIQSVRTPAATYNVNSPTSSSSSYHMQTPSFHSPQHSPRQLPYQPLQPMTCEALQDPNKTPTPQNRSFSTPGSKDTRFNATSSFSFDAGESLAEAFSEEMLAWYEDQDQQVKPATLV